MKANSPIFLFFSLSFFRSGQKIPVYDFTTHSRKTETVTKYGANVIIFEGIFTFATPQLRNIMDLKIFVDEDEDIRLARSVQKRQNLHPSPPPHKKKKKKRSQKTRRMALSPSLTLMPFSFRFGEQPRRLKRDIEQRGRSVEGTLKQ
jgi:uridine kinase